MHWSGMEQLCRYLGIPHEGWDAVFGLVDMELVRQWCRAPSFLRAVKEAKFVRFVRPLLKLTIKRF